MPRLIPSLVVGGTVALGACAVAPPTGPTVMALPGPGKSFEQFQREDFGCRQYADAQTGYGAPAAAASQAGVGSALLGTGLGAAAGALLGAAAGHAGTGAAIGAGSGLLLGSAVGAGNAAASGAAVQQRYDMAYAQCMYGHGNQVPAAPAYPPPAPYPYVPEGSGYLGY
jgi:OmpA family protein